MSHNNILYPARLKWLCIPALCILSATSMAAETEDPALKITITNGIRSASETTVIKPLDSNLAGPSTATLLKQSPGANVNFNGPLTGIIQYRGMFDDRINTQLDGVEIAPACPNHMDPPLHYAAKPLVESIEIFRGIAPVSAGNETIGGAVKATRKTSHFTNSDDFEYHGDVTAEGQSVDNGYGVGALLTVANKSHRMHVLGNMEQGDDMRYSDGKIHPSEYERSEAGFGYGYRQGSNEYSIEYMQDNTGNTGTPALPMDIRYMDTNAVSAQYKGQWDNTQLEAKIYSNHVKHDMTNYHLRDPANLMMLRDSPSISRTTGVEISTITALNNSELKLGIDSDLQKHDARVLDPNNTMFYVDNFNDIERGRIGLFSEWQLTINNDWQYELGVRFTQVNMDANDVNASMAVAMPASGLATLRDRFNSSDRSQTDNNVDLVAKLQYQASDNTSMDIGIARKTRSPSYQERYLWLPLEATAGLADGKLYVGDVNLKPEVATELDMGLEWQGDTTRITPRIFYNRVDDYIQGVPSTDITVLAVSSQPDPLQFSNVSAELYGFDSGLEIMLNDAWLMDASISYVRGKRRDIDDNLYRIAPLNGALGLSYAKQDWSATVQGVFAADQKDVSATNGEQATGGYGIMNLFGKYRLQANMDFTAGINNVFDRYYADHLNGVNRVTNTDLAVGERLPGAGRSVFARLHYSW